MEEKKRKSWVVDFQVDILNGCVAPHRKYSGSFRAVGNQEYYILCAVTGHCRIFQTYVCHTRLLLLLLSCIRYVGTAKLANQVCLNYLDLNYTEILKYKLMFYTIIYKIINSFFLSGMKPRKLELFIKSVVSFIT